MQTKEGRSLWVARRKMQIKSVVLGGEGVTSLVVLVPAEHPGTDQTREMPIRIGNIEAAAIGMGVRPRRGSRPMTHDLLASTVSALGAHLDAVDICNVEGTTFYARLELTASDGSTTTVDARPSDALALAVRTGAPIFAEQEVLDTAGMPDFDEVARKERESEMKIFHEFVEGLSPEIGRAHV